MIEAQLREHPTDVSRGKSEVRNRVREFILQNFYVADAQRLDDDTSLLDHGIVDSTGVLEVIAFLESEFGIRVSDDEIVPENLDSLARIAAYVDRKRTD